MGSTNPELEIINPLNYEGWDDLLISNQDYTFFHSSIWARVLYESYQYHPTYFTLFDHNKLLALVPVMEIRSILTGRRGVSLPFSDYCDPLITEEIQFQDILNDILRYGKRAGWKFFELRGGGNFYQDISPSQYYCGHTLNLTQNEEHLFLCFRSSTQRNIKKAIKEGIEVNICHSSESIKEFHRLNCMTRKRHGIPPQPYFFFRKIVEHVISEYHGFVVLASYMGRPIAGAVFFHFGEKAMYKYGASDASYQPLRANNLIMWEAIRWYSQNGYRSLCFGITHPENKGLLQFKDGWGTKRKEIQYLKYDLGKEDFVREKSRPLDFDRSIFKSLPIPLLRVVGSVSYRHIG